MATLDTRPANARVGARASSPYDLILVALALAFGFLGLRPLNDPDVWWHLRTGEMLLENGFTTTDPWSHASTNPWLLHEWASEVVMYLSYAAGGYHGVILLHAIGMLVLAVVLLRSVRREADPGVAAVAGVLALGGVYLGSAERPQLVSWILLAAVLPSLRRWVSDCRPPWWLIPVSWIWANLHGLWASVLVLFACLVLGLVIEVGLRGWRVYGPFLAVGLLSAGVGALTPNGPALLLAPLHVREYARFVAEWNPPSLMNPFFGCAYLLLAIVVISWARGRRAVPAHEIALVMGATVLGLMYVRTVPILAITTAPLAAAGLQAMIHAAPPVQTRLSVPDRTIMAVLTGATVIGASVWLSVVPPYNRDAPWEASAALDALPGRARVLNEYGLGGWMLWAARDTSPAVDGRAEIYSPEHVEQAIGAPRMEEGWQKFIRRSDFDAVWLRRETPLVYALRKEGWQSYFRDKDTIILVPAR